MLAWLFFNDPSRLSKCSQKIKDTVAGIIKKLGLFQETRRSALHEMSCLKVSKEKDMYIDLAKKVFYRSIMQRAYDAEIKAELELATLMCQIGFKKRDKILADMLIRNKISQMRYNELELGKMEKQIKSGKYNYGTLMEKTKKRMRSTSKLVIRMNKRITDYEKMEMDKKMEKKSV